MKILLYGNETEYMEAAALLPTLPLLAGRECRFVHVMDRESFQEQLVLWKPDLAIVLEEGAAGMEGVYTAKDTSPAVPVFWFSDDPDFGIQSYRLNCTYFSTKPVTRTKYERALARCPELYIM